MLRVWECMVQYRRPTSTIGKFASRTRWGIHLDISHEHKAWLILDLMSQKTTNECDIIFYERLFLEQFREDERANVNRVYANDGHSYATPEDEAAAAILEHDTRGEFTRGDRRSSDDNDDDSSGAGAGATSGSGGVRGAAPPAPEQESDDDSIATTSPSLDYNFSGSTLPPQRRHVSSSRRIRAKLSQDHTAKNDARRWMQKLRHSNPATPGCSSIEQQSKEGGFSSANGSST
ncbi:unnamed protein product [Closterium sp. NIES-54]